MENKKRTTIRSSWPASRIVAILDIVADICTIVATLFAIIA